MKCINRTITTTTAYGQEYNPETQEYNDYSSVFDGDMTIAQCNEAVRKTNPFVMITNVEKATHKYSMPLSYFVQFATIED